jgi:hypothetical protein
MNSSNTCDMYMCRLRHINDLVLSSLKMEGIRLHFLGKELYMFRTDLPFIIRSLNTAFTAIDICHACYVHCLLADIQHN